MIYDRQDVLSAMSRRNFLIATLIGGAVMNTSAFAPRLATAAEPVVATFDDLSAPTPQEIEQERVRAKLRRQQQAASDDQEGAGGRTYGDSLKREREKQKSLNKGKKQRRDDLCEKLGRGC